MVQKSDRIAERLQKLIEEERLRKAALDVLISFPAWEADPILGRATQLRESVTLRAEQTALGKAFKAFDLDPNVPSYSCFEPAKRYGQHGLLKQRRSSKEISRCQC